MRPAKRHQLGQWFTPPPVADLALSMVLPGEPAVRSGLRLLDPTCGDGVFLASAAGLGVDPCGLCGFELDPAAAAAAATLVPGARIHTGDLFDMGTEESFDLVVGNPPYVRQERLGAAAKQHIADRLKKDWPQVPPLLLEKLVGRGDLAVAVIARALRLCRPGGRVAMVVSTALLDSGYGRALFDFVGQVGTVSHWIEASDERWFADAAVNAAIVIIERTTHSAPRPVVCARLTVGTETASQVLAGGGTLERVADLRTAPSDQAQSWAVALRAPEVWFDYRKAAGSRLRPLAEFAEVRRGLTSGANDIFYLSRQAAAEHELEPSHLAPLLRSPRQVGGESVYVRAQTLDRLVLLAPAEEKQLAGVPNIRRYLHDRRQAAQRPTLRSRNPWWALPARPARLFLTKAYAGRFVQRFAPMPVIADQRLYSLHPKPGVSVESLAAVLNSSFTALALESLGRSSLGEGALEWTVEDARRLPVIDPSTVGSPASHALETLGRRAIETVDREAAREDRAALDAAVAGSGPLVRMLSDIHQAMTRAVAGRTQRARSGRPGGPGG